MTIQTPKLNKFRRLLKKYVLEARKCKASLGIDLDFHCHGNPKVVETINVTPEGLWNGYGFGKQPNQIAFKGLNTIINNSDTPQGPYHIVCAQCYGKHFSNQLKQLIGSTQKEINCIGLSHTSTFSTLDESTLKFFHLDLYQYMKENFENAQDPVIEIKQCPGLGAFTQLSLHDLDNAADEFKKRTEARKCCCQIN